MLSIFELAEDVLVSERHFAASSWSSDGSALAVAWNGRLFGGGGGAIVLTGGEEQPFRSRGGRHFAFPSCQRAA